MKKRIKKILILIIVCITLVTILIVGFKIKERVRINAIIESHKTEQTAEQNDVLSLLAMAASWIGQS
jgi:hypothetical protein